MFYLIIIALGGIIGSFLNVCIYRIPRNESIISPASYCPHCKSTIKWYDNIPILSFILLKGKCRNCHQKISIQYPLVECITILIFLILYTKFGISSELLFYIIFSSFLITLAGIDIEWQILPDVLNYSLLIIGILANTIFFKALKESIIGAIIGFLFLYTIVFLSKGGMGFGDVKLGAALGASLGVKKIIETFFLAFLLGGIIGILLIVLKIKKGKDSIPFGPFLSLGAIITIIFEERIDELFIFFP